MSQGSRYSDRNVLDEYKDMSITYTFGEVTEVIDHAKIMSWLKVNGSKVTVDKKQVREYVAGLASKYNTIYKKRKFKTHSGKTIEVEQKEYGYQIDQKKEVKQIVEDIKGKEAIYAKQ